MAELLDSGSRRSFDTGAVRDIAEGKGRCDLLPLDAVSPLMPNEACADVLNRINMYMTTGEVIELYRAIISFGAFREWSNCTSILEASIQYEDGALKYGEHNWEKGIPIHCYIDSGVRHFLKCVDGRNDEPHDRAFVWNMLGAIWTHSHMPDMIDIEFPNSATSNDIPGEDAPNQHIQ